MRGLGGILCASSRERMRTAASCLPGRLCGVFAEHGPTRSEDRAQSKNDTVPGGIAGRLNHGEAVPWRNGDEGGVAGHDRHTTFGTGPTRSCAARGGRKKKAGRGMTVLFPFSLDTGVHFVGGDPQSAEFCDGPGPGMALEQNPFLPPTTTGRGIRKTVLRSSDGAT